MNRSVTGNGGQGGLPEVGTPEVAERAGLLSGGDTPDETIARGDNRPSASGSTLLAPRSERAADQFAGNSGRHPGHSPQDGHAGFPTPAGTASEAPTPGFQGRVNQSPAAQEAAQESVLAGSDGKATETAEPAERSSSPALGWSGEARVHGQPAFAVHEAGGETASPGSPDWAREVVRMVQKARPDGSQEAFLQLQPEHLGKLLVRVTVSQGRVSVQIRAESESTEALLRSHLGLLRHALEEHGLRLEQVQLETVGHDERLGEAGHQNPGQHQDGNPRFSQQGRSSPGLPGSSRQEEPVASTAEPAGTLGSVYGRTGIDLRA